MKTLSFSLLLPALGALIPLPLARAWETYPDDQLSTSLYYRNAPYPWVFFDSGYGQPGHGAYKGVWRVVNSWPSGGASVTIRHQVKLTNERYNPTGAPGGELIPFPDTAGGYLKVNALNFEPGGGVLSSLEIFAFDGASTWDGGYLAASNFSRLDGSGGRGQLQNKGIITVRNGVSTLGRTGPLYNTNRINVESSLGMEAGLDGLYNQSGVQPDVSWAELNLSGDGSAFVLASGGGGAYPIIYNYGVLRKSGGGTSTVGVPVNNHAEAEVNRAGTVAVDAGTLLFDTSGYGESSWHGMKAEIAPGAALELTGSHSFESGTVTVSGGGILRLKPQPGRFFQANTGITDAVLAAPPGALECAGAELRRLVNAGTLTVTAYSQFREMVNKGYIRSLANLGITLFTNGTATDRNAVLELDGESDLVPFNGGATLTNYGLLRKTGAGTMEIQGTSTHYGGGTNLNIEVTGGLLKTVSAVNFENGSNIRVANGAVVEFAYRNYQQGGTLSLTGSGKYYLDSGSILSTTTPEVPRTLNSAPGVFDCRGGSLQGPFTNAGEITVSAPSSCDRSFIGDNPITNAGTIHCLATSAGNSGSYSLLVAPLVRIPCTPTGVLAFDIAGRPTDYTHWARLNHGGQSSIGYDGTLRITFGSFTPVSGDRWLVIQNSGGTPNTGDFATAEFANVPAGFTPVFEKLATGIRVGLNAAPAPVAYATWAAAQSFSTPAAAAFDEDPDGDGFSNGLECAFGTDPNSRDSAPGVTTVRKDSGGDLFLAARFKRPAAANRPTDLTYIPERSDDMGAWTSDGVMMEVSPPDADGNETLLVHPAEPIDYTKRVFVRLRVQQAP